MLKKILLVDDDPEILEFMEYNLIKEGYKVYKAENGLKAIESAKTNNPDIIILDVMMPVMDGIEACRRLREHPEFNDTIILFLTARNEDYSQIAGFEVGADDYINKPISPRILLARLKALQKRNLSANNDGKIMKFNNLSIDIEKRIVNHKGKNIMLPKKEFQIICLFISNPGKIFSREEIYLKVWGSNIVVSERTLDVHIRKLRKSIGEKIIKTSKGVGYGINTEV